MQQLLVSRAKFIRCPTYLYIYTLCSEYELSVTGGGRSNIADIVSIPVLPFSSAKKIRIQHLCLRSIWVGQNMHSQHTAWSLVTKLTKPTNSVHLREVAQLFLNR